MKLLTFRLPLLVSFLFAASCPLLSQVKVSQGTITLPTYEEGRPDPNPPFDTYATRFNYPYTLRTALTGAKTNHPWRAIFLENEYLKCSVLPDIGGRVYTCIDKISGQPMFYENPSIKKAMIGNRGAWAAFGVEFNFPISHNWVSMSPVDFSYAQHEDGSASVWVGNIDRSYGMQWGVELILKPQSTMLEQKVTLYNRSDVRHRYYWWTNAAIQVWDDSRVQYPMRFAASHGYKEVYRWPIDSTGKDLSLISNQTDGPVSVFVHGSQEPFMAIWNPKTQTGTAHFAEYANLPAKKIWSWGVDPAGLAWRDALSDNHSAYAEVQAGLFRNQETYSFLEPGQTIRFTEYWMPVHGTGGISRANQAGVLHFEARGKDLSVALNVNGRLQNAQVSLSQQGSMLWSGTTDLTPEVTWSHTVTPSALPGKVTFELKDRDGHSLLKHTDGEYNWDPEDTIKLGKQEFVTTPEPDKRTEDDWLQVGRNQELNGELLLALESYTTALKRYPASQSLQIAAGRLAVSLQRFDEAEHWLKSAHARDTPNAEVAYYLGMTEAGLGHVREAQSAFEIAYRQASFKQPAALRLGELRASLSDLQGASVYLEQAESDEPTDMVSVEELEAVKRGSGNISAADHLVKIGLGLDPTDDFLKADAGQIDLQHLAADPNRVLQVAAAFMRLGLYRNALGVLQRDYGQTPGDQSEPGSVLPQQYPLVVYYAAYCKEKLGMDAGQEWKVASKLSTDLVFPSSVMDRVVLQRAVALHDADASAHYLLGTQLFSKGQVDGGMRQWARAKQLDPQRKVLDADLGNAFLILQNEPAQAIASFRQGLQNDPLNAQIYTGLDEAMSLTGEPARERASALSSFPSADDPHSSMPAALLYQLALTRAEANQFSASTALFNGRFFPSEEGGITSDQVLFEVKLLEEDAMARRHDCSAAPAMLEAEIHGKRREDRSSRDYTKLAAIARTCNLLPGSKALLQKAAAGTDPSDQVWSVRANEALGKEDAAQANRQLAADLDQMQQAALSSRQRSGWWYNLGLLQLALHQDQQARKSFVEALLLPDARMSHHLAREAMSEIPGDRR